jgi:DCN1-like protein 1/2
MDVFTRDLWEQSYEFMRDMDASLSKYDPDGAWPFVVDEFVKFHKNSAEKKQ